MTLDAAGGVRRLEDGGDAAVEHLLNWMAFTLQNPGKKLASAVLIIGGQGVGKTLIMALSEIAKSEGSRRIYWETHRDNQTARRLYDSVGTLSEFVKYSRENR